MQCVCTCMQCTKSAGLHVTIMEAGTHNVLRPDVAQYWSFVVCVVFLPRYTQTQSLGPNSTTVQLYNCTTAQLYTLCIKFQNNTKLAIPMN